jgi:hypothetical protein
MKVVLHKIPQPTTGLRQDHKGVTNNSRQQLTTNQLHVYIKVLALQATRIQLVWF